MSSQNIAENTGIDSLKFSTWLFCQGLPGSMWRGFAFLCILTVRVPPPMDPLPRRDFHTALQFRENEAVSRPIPSEKCQSRKQVGASAFREKCRKPCQDSGLYTPRTGRRP